MCSSDLETDAYEFILNQIEKFQFQLNVDRYKLERQLKSGMVQVMKELTKKTICVNDIDSLDLLRAKIERFRGMLQTNIVKGFPTLLCELEIINSRLDNDVDMMSKLLDFGNRLNLLKNESRFVVNSYRYIATQTKNKNKLNQILNLLIELQEEQNKSTAKLLNYNYYDVIAFVYEKLGQKKNAEKARSEERR